ncbi:MAG: phage tail protein I [Georgfuchsia sp.]
MVSRLLPANATRLERAVEATLTQTLDVPIDTLWNPATCPAALLPWLAWALHVTDGEGWALAETEAQKRALLARSIELHRKKGSVWSVIEALRAIGFGDSEILERLPQNHYDGALAYSGGAQYDAFGWAQFRLVADLGEDRPLRADEIDRIIAVVDEWKPLHTELVDVQFKANVADTVASAEAHAISIAETAADILPWGRRYDGSLHHDQGVFHHYDGAAHYDGARDHRGFHASGETYRNAWDVAAMVASLGFTDQQRRLAAYDGFMDFTGHTDYGGSAPVAEDPPMPITVARRQRYDGRMDFARHRYTGADRYAGGFTYFGNLPYAGDVVTHLEA